MIWNLDDLVAHCHTVRRLVDGRWVPARPEPGPLWWRACAAWAVLRGRADAFVWPDQGGER